MVDEDKLPPLPSKEEEEEMEEKARCGGRGRKRFSGESHHPIRSGKTAVQHNGKCVKKIKGSVWFIWTSSGGRAVGALLRLLNGQNLAP